MADIIVYKEVKGKTLTQRMTQHQWDLLGPGTNGWKIKTDQAVRNTPQGQTVKNTVVQKVEVPVEQVETKTPEKPVKSEANHEQFMKATEGISKSMIKNYFDECSPSVDYDNKADVKALRAQLAEYLKFDLVELQKAFS